MRRRVFESLLTSVSLALALLLLRAGTVRAQDEGFSKDISNVAYFDTRQDDNIVKLINPTTQNASTGGFVCAQIYVFDHHEELQECCGCRVTNDGLRVLSVKNDLNANPLGPSSFPFLGAVVVVSSPPNFFPPTPPPSGTPLPSCNPALSYEPTPTLRGTITHTFLNSGAGEGEVNLVDPHTTGPDEIANLQGLCAKIHTVGSGHGICTCGTGDEFAATPKSGKR